VDTPMIFRFDPSMLPIMNLMVTSKIRLSRELSKHPVLQQRQ
jgi:hypothetical protein